MGLTFWRKNGKLIGSKDSAGNWHLIKADHCPCEPAFCWASVVISNITDPYDPDHIFEGTWIFSKGDANSVIAYDPNDEEKYINAWCGDASYVEAYYPDTGLISFYNGDNCTLVFEKTLPPINPSAYEQSLPKELQ